VQLIIENLVYLLIFLLLLNRFCSLPINSSVNGFCVFFDGVLFLCVCEHAGNFNKECFECKRKKLLTLFVSY
jgi:hypothetical protein